MTSPGKPAPEPRSHPCSSGRSEGQELREIGEMAVPDFIEGAGGD